MMLTRYGQVVNSFQALQVHLRFAVGDAVFNPNNESHAQVAGCCSLIPIYRVSKVCVEGKKGSVVSLVSQKIEILSTSVI